MNISVINERMLSVNRLLGHILHVKNILCYNVDFDISQCLIFENCY